MSFEKFKFRAYINVLARDEYDNDKIFRFLVYNIGLFSNGEIGFTDDELDDALEKTDFSEIEKENIKEELDNYKNEFDYYNYWADSIEQCTGLKDKNGNLIYENDVVRYGSNTSVGVVKYGEFNCTCCEGVYGWYFDNYEDIRNYEYYEVVGNIHERKEEK